MSREIIAFEGREMIPGQLIQLGTLTWGDKPIPVMRYPMTGDVIDLLGYATELRREEDGSITAELGIGEYSVLLVKDVAATVTVHKAKWEEDVESDVRRVKHVTSGVIREVFLTPEVPWVGKRPGDVVEPMEPR